MNIDITEKQKKVLELIYDSIKNAGFPPTLAELRDDLGVVSNQSVLNFLDALEKRGCIEREEGQARAIKISRLGLKILGKDKLVPVLGTSAAGSHIETLEETSFDWISVPAGLFENENIEKSKEELFAVKIQGDSMINAGIDDGDMLLIKKTREFVNGDIVVARTDEGTTVKRFIVEGGKRYLQPENPAYEKMIIIPGEVKFQGKVILNLSKINNE